MNGSASPDYPLGPALDFLRRLWRLNHALEKLSSRMDRQLGVTAQQRLLIRCVGKYPGVTAGQLAALLHIDPGTASATLKRLEQKRLIERRRDPRDSRRVSLGLTAQGRRLDQPRQGTVEETAERLLDEISADDVARAAAILEKFTELLETNHARKTRVPVRRPRRRQRSL